MMYKYGYDGSKVWFLVDLPDTRLISPSVLVGGIKQKMSEGKSIWEALDTAEDVDWVPSLISVELYGHSKEFKFWKNKYSRASQILGDNKYSLQIGINIGETRIPLGSRILHFKNPDEVLKTILKSRVDGLPLLEHYAVYKYIRKDTRNVRI